MKLPGAQGLRVDLLAPGEPLGAHVRIPELDWVAQAVPYYEYLLEAPEPAAVLAGGHCVPVRLPQPARMVWHKLYSSTQRKGFREKSAKDRIQSLTLAAVLADEGPGSLEAAFADAPSKLVKSVRPLCERLVREDWPEIRSLGDRSPQRALLDFFGDSFGAYLAIADAHGATTRSCSRSEGQRCSLPRFSMS